MLTSEHGEERFVKALAQHGARDIVRSEGYFPDWDIKCDLGTYEVKEDVIALRSERLFMEYRYRGNLSGIASTKADFFVVIVGDSAFFTRTENWRDFIRQNWQYLKRMKGGDNGWSEGVFILMEHLTPSYISRIEVWKLEPYESSITQRKTQRTADGSAAHV